MKVGLVADKVTTASEVSRHLRSLLVQDGLDQAGPGRAMLGRARTKS